jgi:hypothetical protein
MEYGRLGDSLEHYTSFSRFSTRFGPLWGRAAPNDYMQKIEKTEKSIGGKSSETFE